MNELAEAVGCPHCGTLISRDQGLCSTCMLGAIRYPEQNEVILRAWIDCGLAQFEPYLTYRAEFDEWLVAHKEAQ